MRIDLMVHIAAGCVGVVTGYVALYSVKGATLHRKSGMLFVYSMLTMAILGSLMAAIWGKDASSNVAAGVLTAYLVITALTTVSPPAGWSRRLDLLLLLVVLVVGLADLMFGFEALTSAGGKNRFMVIPFSVFGTVSLLAAAGDVRMLRAGALRGAPRLARHLWRMCFALGIAALSALPRLGRIIPKPYRSTSVLLLPVLVVLVTMVYWLWRVRGKRFTLAARQPQSPRVQVSLTLNPGTQA